MQIFLLATSETSKLAPLTTSIPTPLVPVVDRPVMARTVESLARQGYKELVVSVYHLAGQIEQHFGSGRRWGVDIRYVLQREPWGSAGALKWAASQFQGTCVVIPADILIDLDLAPLLEIHQTRQSMLTVVGHQNDAGPYTYGGADNHIVTSVEQADRKLSATGVYLVEPEVLEHIPPRQAFALHGDVIPKLHNLGWPVHLVETTGYWNPLNNSQEYQGAQRDYLCSAWRNGEDSRIGEARPRHPDIRGTEVADGIWVGRHLAIHPSARLSPPIYIGERCQIGADVELGPETVIAQDVIVEDGATVHASTILPQTRVGQLINIDGRVVHKRLLVDVATGEATDVPDEFLLSAARPSMIGTSLRSRLDAAFALLLLWWLWPLLLVVGVVSLLTEGRVLVSEERRTKVRNQERFHLLHFARAEGTGLAARIGEWLERSDLYRLPELWNVVRGELALVGVKPLTDTEVNHISQPWQMTRDEHRCGFTGLWYIQTDREAELDEVLVADAYYAATRSWLGDAKLVTETPAAWWRRTR